MNALAIYIISLLVGFSGWYSGILCPSNAKRGIASALPWLFISLFFAAVITKVAGH